MSKRREEFSPNTDLVLVVFGETTNLAGYDVPDGFTMLIDSDRSVYRSYGLGRGTTRRVYGPKMVARYIEIFRSNGLSRLKRATEDTLQLGGDFIINPDGTLAYGYWSEGPDDRPSVDELLDALSQRTL